jgi:hypothetical protein
MSHAPGSGPPPPHVRDPRPFGSVRRDNYLFLAVRVPWGLSGVRGASKGASPQLTFTVTPLLPHLQPVIDDALYTFSTSVHVEVFALPAGRRTTECETSVGLPTENDRLNGQAGDRSASE